MNLYDMTFYDLLDSYEFEDIEDTFSKLYPKDFSRHVISYEESFESIKEIDNTIDNDCVIAIEHVDEDDIYEHVYGKDPSSPYNVGLSLTSWSEWLGMKFTPQTLDNYTVPEIICHCIWEMTFYGHNEIEIQQTISGFEKSLQDSLENFENFENFASAEALFEEIDDIEEQNESRKVLAEMLRDEIESSSSS